MKNKNTLIALLVIICLVSLYFNFQSSEVRVPEKASDSELFDKKQKCSVNKSKIEADLEKQYFENENIVTSYHLDEIWFSPSLNSCLYSINEMIQYLKDKKLIYAYAIKDYFSNELIIHISEIPGTINRMSALNDFEAKKIELKK